MAHPKKNFGAKSLKSAKWTCLPNMVSLAQKKNGPPLTFFFAKSLKSAKWTCLPNMVSLAQWEVGPKKIFDAYAYYNQPILMANSCQQSCPIHTRVGV